MKIMFLGDVHGNKLAARLAIQAAVENQVTHIIWCGDCGLWPGTDGMDFLDEVNWFSRRVGVTNYWVGGNHEDWDQWINVLKNPKTPESGNGFKYLRSHILLAPRVHLWKWDNKTFAAVAGAVSIDKQWRTEGKSWWPQEVLSDAEFGGAEKWFGGKEIDYMVSHDCSNYTPWKSRLKADPDSQINRQKMDKVISAARPKMHFHGHMHQRYEWPNSMSHGLEFETKTFGLECDGDRDNYLVLDTETNEVFWRGVEPSYLTKQI